MSTQVLRPETLSSTELDRLLARGWYRMGPALFTCRSVALEDQVLRSAIWTRTDLRSFAFSPGQRKALNRLKRRYRITRGPARIDDVRQTLYTQYLTVAPGDRRRESLTSVLYSGTDSSPFETQELAVWEGEDLVAFCWYDLGHTSVMSVLGAYDPARSRESLGFGTLLLELDQALSEDRHFHYCGYVLPGAPVMDYKLRVATELYEPDQDRWSPIAVLPSLDLVVDRMQRALITAEKALSLAGLPPRYGRYLNHEVGVWNPHLPETLDHPLLLDCGRLRGQMMLVAWDLDDGCYQAMTCRPARFSTTADDGFLVLLLIEDRLNLPGSAEDLAQTLLAMGVEALEPG